MYGEDEVLTAGKPSLFFQLIFLLPTECTEAFKVFPVSSKITHTVIILSSDLSLKRNNQTKTDENNLFSCRPRRRIVLLHRSISGRSDGNRTNSADNLQVKGPFTLYCNLIRSNCISPEASFTFLILSMNI